MNTTEEEVEFDYQAYTREHGPELSKIRPAQEVLQQRREAFKARLVNHENMEIKQARALRHVFISYCQEDKAAVDRLCQTLTAHGITVWLDRDNLNPGVLIQQAIQQAIAHSTFFVACFSKEYNVGNKTFMNEELSVAIENLQHKPVDKVWFIPVKLNACELPDIDIGGGETLRSLQPIALHEDWDAGIQQILDIIPPAASENAKSAYTGVKSDSECVLFRSVEGRHYFIPFQKVHWGSTDISLTLCPASCEQAALLSALRKGQHDVIAFAHAEDALWVKPREVSQISTEGETLWELLLTKDTTGKAFKYRTEKVYCEELTLAQIAAMRAKRLLLDEKLETASTALTQKTIFHQMLLEGQLRGELSSQYGNKLQAFMSPIPPLYQHFRDTPEKFERFARLISVLYLKLSNTVEDILQLDMELLTPAQLQVKFRGRQLQLDVNEEPTLLELEGICLLPE